MQPLNELCLSKRTGGAGTNGFAGAHGLWRLAQAACRMRRRVGGKVFMRAWWTLRQLVAGMDTGEVWLSGPALDI